VTPPLRVGLATLALALGLVLLVATVVILR
jgi:hypothetical protein